MELFRGNFEFWKIEYDFPLVPRYRRILSVKLYCFRERMQFPLLFNDFWAVENEFGKSWNFKNLRKLRLFLWFPIPRSMILPIQMYCFHKRMKFYLIFNQFEVFGKEFWNFEKLTKITIFLWFPVTVLSEIFITMILCVQMYYFHQNR